MLKGIKRQYDLCNIRKYMQLYSLSIINCSNIDDDLILQINIDPNYTLFNDIVLINCDLITDSIFTHLQNADMNFIELNNCNQITTNGFRYIANYKNLKMLKIEECSNIIDSDLRFLSNLENIEELRLGCSHQNISKNNL